MKNAKVALAILLPLLLAAGGGWYYFAQPMPKNENSHIPVQEILVNNKTAVYHHPKYYYPQNLLCNKSEYDVLVSYWYNLWINHNYYNFTEEFSYEGKKYADVSLSIYPVDIPDSANTYVFLVNTTYHGYMGNLVKFTSDYVGYNLPEVWKQEYKTEFISVPGSPDNWPGVISLDENVSLNYTSYLREDGIYAVTPNSFYSLVGPWWNLTYNITTNAKNLKISSEEGIVIMWISPNATLPFFHVPIKLGFWIKEGGKILEFSTVVTFKMPLIDYGIALPEPAVNITKVRNRSVKLEIEPSQNYTNIYVFWMDGNYTVTKSKVVWHNYTESGEYPVMVFYSYRGKGMLEFYTISHTLYKLNFDGFELSRIWNDRARVEVSIDA